MESFMFLFKLAWASRFRLPLLITVGFMVLDIRMQLEINIQTRNVRRVRNVDGWQDRHLEQALDTISEESWPNLEVDTTTEGSSDGDDDEQDEDGSDDDSSSPSKSQEVHDSDNSTEECFYKGLSAS